MTTSAAPADFTSNAPFYDTTIWDGDYRLDTPPGGIDPRVWRSMLADMLHTWREGENTYNFWPYFFDATNGAGGSGIIELMFTLHYISDWQLVEADDWDRRPAGTESVERSSTDYVFAAGDTPWSELTAQQRQCTYPVPVVFRLSDEEVSPQYILQCLAEIDASGAGVWN